MKFKTNRKGEGEMMHETIIYLVLNAVFIIALMLFVAKSTIGAATYEQAYAKKTALAIDSASPGTKVYLDASGLVDITRKYQKLPATKGDGEILAGLVKVDNSLNKISVSVSGKNAYTYRFFTDADAEISADGKFLIIEVKESVKKNV